MRAEKKLGGRMAEPIESPNLCSSHVQKDIRGLSLASHLTHLQAPILAEISAVNRFICQLLINRFVVLPTLIFEQDNKKNKPLYRRSGKSSMAQLLIMFAILLGGQTGLAYAGPTAKDIRGKVTITPSQSDVAKAIALRDEIQTGEKISTDSHSSVKLEFGGNQLILGHDAEVRFVGSDAGVWRYDIIAGMVRGVVRKLPTEKPRLILHTKTAAMGVRGTDFVFESDAKGDSSLHVLNGTVDVAKDENTIMSGAATKVTKDESVTASKQGIGNIEKFDQKTYLNSLENAQPELFQLSRQKLIERFSLLNFRFSGAYGHQSSGGWYGTAEASWNPRFSLTPRFGVLANAGIFPLRLGNPSQEIVAYSLAILGDCFISDDLSVEAGIGRQDWGNYTLAGWEYLANVKWQLPQRKQLNFVRALVVGLNYYDRPSYPYDPAIRGSVGVEFQF